MTIDTTIANPGNAAHVARIKPVGRRVRVLRGGAVLADTTDAVWVMETGRDVYDPVIYLPVSDATAELAPVDGKSTHCPLKGDAAYLSHAGTEIAWTYDRPLPSAPMLAGLVAFDPTRVTIEITGTDG